MLITRDGTRLISNGTVVASRLWNATTGKQFFDYAEVSFGGYAGIALSPDERLAGATAYSGNPITAIWEARTGQLLRQVNLPANETGSLAFNPDGFTSPSAATNSACGT